MLSIYDVRSFVFLFLFLFCIFCFLHQNTTQTILALLVFALNEDLRGQ